MPLIVQNYGLLVFKYAKGMAATIISKDDVVRAVGVCALVIIKGKDLQG